MKNFHCGALLLVCCFLVVYFHLYLSTDFRHILISTNAAVGNDRSAEAEASGVSWSEILGGPLEQNSSRLLGYIRSHILNSPPSAEIPYNLSKENTKDTSMGQANLILRALNNLRNGFFVECGAWDGETRSNTLFLERDFGWKGLLVEADPRNYEQLKLKNRKAWSTNVCLAVKPYPHRVFFEQHGSRGKILGMDGHDDVHGTVDEIQCFPLFSLLSALNQSHVDYLSLDVEGVEVDILSTIPLEFLSRIRSLSVEYSHVPGGRNYVKRWMTAHGFAVFGEVRNANNLANDLIFVNGNRINSILWQRLRGNISN